MGICRGANPNTLVRQKYVIQSAIQPGAILLDGGRGHGSPGIVLDARMSQTAGMERQGRPSAREGSGVGASHSIRV